jgi:uncharacterized NAD(P)/FAD-binding protein YdhS
MSNMCVSSLTHHHKTSDPVDSYKQQIHRLFNDVISTAEGHSIKWSQLSTEKRRKKEEEEADTAYLKADLSIQVRNFPEKHKNLIEDSEHLGRMQTEHLSNTPRGLCVRKVYHLNHSGTC